MENNSQSGARYTFMLSADDDSDSSLDEENKTMMTASDQEEELLNSSDDEPLTDQWIHKKAIISNRLFCLSTLKVNNNTPLKINTLPRSSDNVASLQLLAASRYHGNLAVLPQRLALFVTHIRQMKALIFGKADTDFNNKCYRILSYAIAGELEEINSTWREEHIYVVENYRYRYCVSLNGVPCGIVHGPKEINYEFVHWIHLRLGLFAYLRVRHFNRKWRNRGFKIYRFTPMPCVTALRIFLRDSVNGQRAMIHVTRQFS